MARFVRVVLRDLLLFMVGFVACNMFSSLFVSHAYPTLELANYKHTPGMRVHKRSRSPQSTSTRINTSSLITSNLNLSNPEPSPSDLNPKVEASGRRIILGFPFFREFTLLDERLRSHPGVVDCMIVAESKYSHSGDEKRLHMKEALDSNSEWRKAEVLGLKLVHVVDSMPNMFNKGKEKLWGQEVQSRRAIAQGLAQCQPNDDDIVVITDADEVLDSLAFVWLKHTLQHGQVAVVPLAWHLYNKCWIHKRPTEIAVATTYKTLRDSMQGDTHNVRAARGKNLRKIHYRLRQYAGFHCSWCFGSDYEAFREKAANYNPGDGGDRWRRQEFTDERIKKLRENGLWLDGNPHGQFICH